MSNDAELAELAALTAEHLRWEMDLGNRDLPDVRAALADAIAPIEGANAHARGSSSAAPAPPSGEASGQPSEEETARRIAALNVIAEQAASCTTCRLHEGRTRSVFARGHPDAPLVFVGEGPGFHEDQQGRPFVGKAGQLLDRMIDAMGFSQDEIYICNVVKCRPPENRTPQPDEAAACMPFLRQQLGIVRPKVIVALGRCAAENLGVAEPGRRWRGIWGSFGGVRVMPTYHPAYLLRNPEQKRPVWQDLQTVMSEMRRERPARR